MSLLVFLLRRSRAIVAFSVLAAALGGAGGVALIILVQRELARPAPSSGVVGWAFAGLCALVALSRVAARVAMARLGQGAVTELATRLCRDLLRLPLERFERIDPSKLLAVLTEDVVIASGALAGIPQLAIHVPLVGICFAYLGWLSPVVLACGAVFAAAAIAVYLALISPAARHLGRARAGQDALVGHFQTLIAGFRELKQHAPRREAFLSRSLRPAALTVRDRSIAGQTFYALAEGWGELAFFAFLGFVLFALPTIHPLDGPTRIGAVLVVLYVMGPLDVVLTWMPTLGRARESIRRVEALLPRAEEMDAERDTARLPLRLREELRLDGVGHAYPPRPGVEGFSLGPVDLVLRPGEVVILAGGNGSGKTTLVKLMAGLYTPDEGTISLDGRPVGEADGDAYRALFSVVFADGHLFGDHQGLDRPSLDAEVRAGLERFDLAGSVEYAAGGYSTLELSQGQRRRLALLAALLEGRPICVFDEWAANQDPQSRRAFYRELLPELKAEGKAVLVISHDEDDFEVADRVVHLRGGRVVEAHQGMLAAREAVS